ncbi:hypothetical protein ACEWPM_018455 [Roseovarius sp. S4756]|uniref:hypothetical protein n=1 Tax=Roseovarius maritimus TaxID=3342637 RepID=UPI00372BCD97
MNQMISNIPPDILKHMTDSDNPPKLAPDDPAAKAPKPSQPSKPQLTAADVQMIHKFLMSQEDGLARRGDLTELHKRIVQMLQTLSQAVGETITKKGADDRKELTARIDTLEDAVNRMEGALRIEFEPVLRKAMADVVAERAMPKRRLGRQMFWTGVILTAGLALGVAFHTELSGLAKQIVSVLSTALG